MVFKIKAKQDIIFFGVSFCEEWCSKEKALQFEWFVHDGDLVLKNQTCCIVNYEDRAFSSLDRLLDFLSYLSGAITLVRCFVNSSSVSVVASSTEHSIFGKKEREAFSEYAFNNNKEEFQSILFNGKGSSKKTTPKAERNQKTLSSHSLAYWEEKAIKAGGGQLEPKLPSKIFQDEEAALRNLKTIRKIFCFNTNYLSASKIESLIKKCPENSLKGVYGSFRPEHCRIFSSGFQVLWPDLLQGYFPRIQMIKCNDTDDPV